MIHLNKTDIENTNRVRRLNLINGVSGIKSANLIGTYSPITGPNLAIFSSVVHIGSDPALLGFITRPVSDVPRNTYTNIRETGYFTINHVHESFIEKAHYTSAKFDKGVSEFERCGLTEEYLYDFSVPFVKESRLKMGMKFVEEIDIKLNGTKLVIGEIQELMLPEDCLDDKGYVRLDRLFDVGIGGLNSYYSLRRMATFPYARVDEVPEFPAGMKL
ncbi:MAG: flavin reductase [Crocinitomicaceae bacterium]|nr:flavin reductase [Crocinitomicaceae bacterium]